MLCRIRTVLSRIRCATRVLIRSFLVCSRCDYAFLVSAKEYEIFFKDFCQPFGSSRYYFLSNPSTVCYFFLIFRVLRVQSRSAEKAIIVFDSHRCDTFFQYQILHHCDDRNMTSGPVMPAFLFSSPLRELSLQEIEEPVLVARHKRLFIFQKVPPSPTTLCAH